MRTREAVTLLAPDSRQLHPVGRWLDLGAGDGTFTLALAELLPAGSTIEAVDRDPAALRRIPRTHAGIAIRTSARDFSSLPFPWSTLAGVLLANALHFVDGQESLLREIARALVPDGALVIVEYDTDVPKGLWVPHPVSERTLARVASGAGFAPPVALGRRRSHFGGEMYAALLRPNRERTFAIG